jgi:hypothetical protein
MSLTKWSRALVLSLFALAAPALAADTGTKVSIKLASGELPEGQQVIKALEAAGTGERNVKVMVQKSDAGKEMTLELWGAFTPAAEIPSTLRAAFPQLASADIQTSELTGAPEPLRTREELDGEAETTTTTTPDGKTMVRKRIIKKQ